MRKYIRERRYVYTAMALATMATLATGMPALADNTTSPTNTPSTWGAGRGNQSRGIIKPGVFGVVTAISGNIITVTNTRGTGTSAVATIYTVDATNAKITKNNTAGNIASILVGDNISAQGTLTGTSLVATTIRDGKINMGLHKGQNKTGTPGQGLPAITGNGQPIVAGTITAISGSTVTITNKSNVTYTIDATNATIHKGPGAATISNLVVGDMVIAQGTVNGNAVVASSVIDQTKPASTTANNESGTTEQPQTHQGGGGFFGGVGAFFAHLFGF